MIYFPGTINIVSTRFYCHIIYINNGFTFHLPAMHVNLLCACWHSEAVKGSSSLSSRRLLISLRITSFLFLCPEPTDAPCPYYEDPTPSFPRWRPHPQGPHTLPFQGPRHLQFWVSPTVPMKSSTKLRYLKYHLKERRFLRYLLKNNQNKLIFYLKIMKEEQKQSRWCYMWHTTCETGLRRREK
jgi:hypothetical protein